MTEFDDSISNKILKKLVETKIKDFNFKADKLKKKVMGKKFISDKELVELMAIHHQIDKLTEIRKSSLDSKQNSAT